MQDFTIYPLTESVSGPARAHSGQPGSSRDSAMVAAARAGALRFQRGARGRGQGPCAPGPPGISPAKPGSCHTVSHPGPGERPAARTGQRSVCGAAAPAGSGTGAPERSSLGAGAAPGPGFGRLGSGRGAGPAIPRRPRPGPAAGRDGARSGLSARSALPGSPGPAPLPPVPVRPEAAAPAHLRSGERAERCAQAAMSR